MDQVKKAVYLEVAPAKINLYLDIKDLREDGFHNIETLFQAINLCDHLTFEISASSSDSKEIDFYIEIDSNNPIVKMLGENNIVAKAIESFFAAMDASKNKKNKEIVSGLSSVDISIFIDKNIPLEAGLAGGSSNAAATLRALNLFFEENFGSALDDEELQATALEIGSDVPFSLISTEKARQYAKSRGEEFCEIDNKELKKFKFDDYPQVLVVKPSFGVSTKEAFYLIDKSQKQAKNEDAQDKAPYFNGFEELVFKEHPRLKEIKSLLLDLGCDHSFLSGSGSTIIGLINKKTKAEPIYKKAVDSINDVDLVLLTSFRD